MSAAGFGRLTDPPASFLLAGARIVDPAGGSERIGDLAVVEGMVVEPHAVPDGVERIEAHGLVVAPGLCDLHVHLRDPGDHGTETIASGARAAARGGFTTVCAMPNTDPPIDDARAVAAILDRARDAACRIRVVGAVTQRREGAALADLRGMADAGAIAFSDDGAGVPDDGLVRDALAILADLGLPLVEHAEDAALADAGVMRAGPIAARLGLRPWDPGAEVSIVERDLSAAAATGARLHLTHLSDRRSVEAIAAARALGVAVTCDVTPHHLALTDAWVGGDRRFAWDAPDAPGGAGGAIDTARAYDGSCRVNPPLSSKEEALGLLAAVDEGAIDAIATDHAPHPSHRKLVPFDEAAPGLIGLETALSIGLAAVEAGRLSLLSLLAALSVRPASVIGEARGLAVGVPADLVAFDPSARWRVERASLASSSANTPLLGMELPGVVTLTVASGRITYRR